MPGTAAAVVVSAKFTAPGTVALGVSTPVTPAGLPLNAIWTVPANPPVRVTVNVPCADDPAARPNVAGAAATEKPTAEEGVMVNCTGTV